VRKFWPVVDALPPSPARSAISSATSQNFLPPKLEPLGFSLDGQLRVAP